MKAVRSIASLLVLLLVCGTSWAAACGFACQMEHTLSTDQATMSCHHATMHMAHGECSHMHGHQMTASPQPHDMGMEMMASPASACESMGCEQTSQDADRAGDMTAFSVLSAPQQIVVAVVAPDLSSESASRLELDSSPGNTSGFDPLLVSIRV